MTVFFDAARYARRICRAMFGKDIFTRPQVRIEKITLGNSGASWTFCADRLNVDSIVYSVGVGMDISFDLGLITLTGAEVHAFDPTPKSIQWISSVKVPERFRFHPYGVSDFNGDASFDPPDNPAHVSHRLSREAGGGMPTVVGKVLKMSSIMEMLGHDRIDLLKMDIEGEEYRVIDDILASRIDIGQLLIEFHHLGIPEGVGRTKDAIARLNSAGYRVFDVSPAGSEVGFIKL